MVNQKLQNLVYMTMTMTRINMTPPELMANQKLQNLLYMVLVAGNFLNSGGYAGHF